MKFSQLFSLPLLTKEMIEQAQSRRTYTLRVVYATIFYSLALWQYHNTSGGGATGFENLGRGREFFLQLTFVQTCAIVLLLPAITCGALTVEKEKDTLALLLLTKLSPWTIVFEKLLSRIFSMATFQLLSLPLFAIVYSIGGVELADLINAIALLMSLTMFVGSVSILCSTWFRTTSESFIAAYLSLFFLGCFFSIFGGPGLELWQMSFHSESGRSRLPLSQGISNSIGDLTFALLVSLIPVFLASNILVARAFVPAWNMVLESFQRADRFFNDLNKKTTGGIVLVQDNETLPLYHPISWRETRKKSLGTFRYQFRILMLLLAPLIVVIAAVMTDGRTEFTTPFRGFPAFFWLVSVVCLTIHSTGVMPSERIRQTLDVLLVAPLTPAEIVLQKLSGVRRLIKILTVPFVVLIVFQAIWTGYIVQETDPERRSNLELELVAASLSAIVYMPLLMWIGFEFGLRMKTQIQAVLSTFATVAIICVLPGFVMFFLDEYALRGVSSQPAHSIPAVRLFVVGPWQITFGVSQLARASDYWKQKGTGVFLSPRLDVWGMLAVHFGLFAALGWWLRRNAIRTFSRFVRRMEPNER